MPTVRVEVRKKKIEDNSKRKRPMRHSFIYQLFVTLLEEMMEKVFISSCAQSFLEFIRNLLPGSAEVLPQGVAEVES